MGTSEEPAGKLAAVPAEIIACTVCSKELRLVPFWR
jgi:hypothetical protein